MLCKSGGSFPPPFFTKIHRVLAEGQAWGTTSSSSRLSNWLVGSQAFGSSTFYFLMSAPWWRDWWAVSARSLAMPGGASAPKPGLMHHLGMVEGLAAPSYAFFSAQSTPPADPRVLTGPLIPCEVNIFWPQETWEVGSPGRREDWLVRMWTSPFPIFLPVYCCCLLFSR